MYRQASTAGAILLELPLIVLLLQIHVGQAFVALQQERRIRPFSGQSEQFAGRVPFITGNWKLNPSTRQEAVQLASEIAQSVTPSSPGDVALFVPYPFIECVQSAVGDRVCVGAEVG